MSLSVLDFVRAKRGPRSKWVYGYVSDVGQPIDGVADWEWIEVQYHNGIKPTTELFAPNQVRAISEEVFDVKTKGQTALHSRYWDDKEKRDKWLVANPTTHVALVVTDEVCSPRSDYDSGNDWSTKIVGVFLVPKGFDRSADRRKVSLDDKVWLKSLRARFTCIPHIEG